MNVSSRRGVFNSRQKKKLNANTKCRKWSLHLMPWALKTKPRKGHTALGLIQKVGLVPEGYPTFSGCFSIFFMPTYLPRHFGQEKRISILKLCLCFVGLPAENEKFRLAVVFRQAGVGLSELWQLRECLDHPCFSWCIGLGRKHLRMTKWRLKNVP